jgi:very-short-patch-repair endonuclease
MYRDAQQREFARRLRNNMTDAERRLWRVLRCHQLKAFKFRRQAAIDKFVVDFVCFSHKLIIELDGGQHNDTLMIEYDRERTKWLGSRGFHVLRFWNHDVFENLNGVVDVIWKTLQETCLVSTSPPSPTLPAEGRAQE